MSTWQRMGVAMFSTIALMIGGVLYQQVFANNLFPMIDPAGQFSQPVVWLDRLVPLILVVLALAVWAWVIAGAIQDERTVDRRRVRR
jgi:cell shape-determining protein MreD